MSTCVPDPQHGQRAAGTWPEAPPPNTRPHELPAWMGSTRGAVPTPSANLSSRAKKTFHQAHLQNHEHQLEMKLMQMNSVLGENFGGLGNQRSAPQSAQKCVPGNHAALLNSVWEENLEDQKFPPPRPGTGISTFCSKVRCNREEQDMIVGTSTSSSTICVSRTAVRMGTSSSKILGTSITCSGTGRSKSKKRMTSGRCSTICGTGSSRRGTRGTASTICCTVRRRSRSCGPDRVAILSGRAPPGSSSKRLKSSGWCVCV